MYQGGDDDDDDDAPDGTTNGEKSVSGKGSSETSKVLERSQLEMCARKRVLIDMDRQ